MTEKTTPKTDGQILIVDADKLTIDDLLTLEEAQTIREMVDALKRFTAKSDDPDAAEKIIRQMTVKQLLNQRAGLMEQFNDLNSEFTPN